MARKKHARRKRSGAGRRPNPNAPGRPRKPRRLPRQPIRGSKRFRRGTGKLTGAILRKRMREGGDLAPMTGIASFGPVGGTVTVTVAVAPASDRDNYGLYAASNDSSPSTSTSAIESSPQQPNNDLMDGIVNTYSVGAAFTIDLTFVRDPYTIRVTATIPGTNVQANSEVLFTLC